MEKIFKDFWLDFCYIYNQAKELYILAEEYDDELSSFIQPIKEHKDALEHIVRAYFKYYSSPADEATILNNDDYIVQNLSKAVGHAFRAFYDTADILSIILRERISVNLANHKYNEIVKIWSEYEDNRLVLIEMPKKFAKLRTEKDIAKGSSKKVTMVKEYRENINTLFGIYDHFMKEIYPKLNG